MNTPGLLKCAGAVVALAIVSACGSGSAVAPSAGTLHTSYVGKTLFVNGRPTTAARLNPLPRYAGLVPDRRSKKYEYIINDYGSYASMFNYPASTQMVGQINGAGGQGCTNVLYGYGKKIIWNAGRTNDLITEYKVPSNKVLKTLSLPYTFTSSCAMNTSGDLAIGVLLSNSYGPAGQLVIFKNATGTPTVYNTPLAREYFDGYDPSGNLFADGFDLNYSFALVELPKGSTKAVTIKTSNSPEFPGSVQWDGTYLSVFDQLTSETYQYTVSGTTATLKNTVQLNGAADCAQTWIVKGLLYCGDAGNDGAEVYNYPAGGSPTATLTGNFDLPLGVTAAKK
jgi:hypothetical protein